MTYHEASKTSQTEAHATSDWTPTLARIEQLEAEVERLGGVVRAAWERENRLRADLAISDTEHAVLNAQIDGLVADVEQLRAEITEHLLRADSLRAELARCQAENERMEAAVQAVRDLHCKATDEDDHDWCEECADLSDGEMSYWPCSTIVALDAALGGEHDE